MKCVAMDKHRSKSQQPPEALCFKWEPVGAAGCKVMHYFTALRRQSVLKHMNLFHTATQWWWQINETWSLEETNHLDVLFSHGFKLFQLYFSKPVIFITPLILEVKVVKHFIQTNRKLSCWYKVYLLMKLDVFEP